MAAPLLIGPRLVGVIASVHSDPDRELGPDDLRLLELFAPEAAIAIENARLYTQAQHQQQYFGELVANSPVAIVTLDTSHIVMSCNPAFLSLYGYTEDEVLGRHLDDLITTAGNPGPGGAVQPAGPRPPAGAGALPSGAARTAAWWTWRCSECRWWWTANWSG